MQIQRVPALTLLLLLVAAGPALAAAKSETPLPDAAKMGDQAAVARLLQGGTDVNSPAVDGTTALHWAVYHDDADLAGLLLDAGADANAVNRNGATPVTLACTNSNAEMVERLLGAGADANLAPTGEPPLMTCARTGQVAAVRALRASGADIDAADGWRGQTPLMWAAAENHVGVMNVLLEGGANVDAFSTGQFTALMFAVRQDARDAVRLLIAAGADVNLVAPEDPDATRSRRRNPVAGSLLSIAVSNRHYTVAGMLLEGGADPNASTARGRSVLHDLVASRSPRRHLGNVVVAFTGEDPTQLGSLELIEMLVAKGADANARTEPVPIVHERWTDENIYSAGRPRMDNAVNLGGATPFLLAAQAADVDAMRLLAEHGADPRLATYANNTAVMLAAGVAHVEGSRRFRPEQDALEAVKLAIAAGVDVNAANANGQTALHGGVYRAADSVIAHLVDAGARTDLADELGRTALDLAEQGFNQVASLIRRERSAAVLRDLGATPSTQDELNRFASNAKQ